MTAPKKVKIEAPQESSDDREDLTKVARKAGSSVDMRALQTAGLTVLSLVGRKALTKIAG